MDFIPFLVKTIGFWLSPLALVRNETDNKILVTSCAVSYSLSNLVMENGSTNLNGFQDNSSDSQGNLSQEETALSVRLVKIFALLIVIFTSLVSNALVVRFILSDRRALTVINILILSQSFADIGATVLVIPFAAVSVVEDRWVFGYVTCVVNSFFNMYFTVITLLNLSLISLDRYYSVVKASRHLKQQKSAIWTVVCMWTTTLVFTFPWLPFLSDKVVISYFPGFYICGQRFLAPVARTESGIFVSSCLFIILVPLLVISYSFYQITKHINRKKKRISPTILSTAQKLAIDVYAKSAYTSLMVIVTSLIQVFPACILLAIDGLQVINIPHGLETFLKWIMWCHCFVKPLIYAGRKGNLPIYTRLVSLMKVLKTQLFQSKKQKKKKKKKSINRFCGIKDSAKKPSVIFGTENNFFLMTREGRKGKYLKKAWSIENDDRDNRGIDITLKQTSV